MKFVWYNVLITAFLVLFHIFAALEPGGYHYVGGRRPFILFLFQGVYTGPAFAHRTGSGPELSSTGPKPPQNDAAPDRHSSNLNYIHTKIKLSSAVRPDPIRSDPVRYSGPFQMLVRYSLEDKRK